MPRKKDKRKLSITLSNGSSFDVVPSRGTKHIWVHDLNEIRIPTLLFDAMFTGVETALLDALTLSVDLSQVIRSHKIYLDMKHYSSETEKEHFEEELRLAELSQTDQVRFLSNRWFDLRHEARKRGEKIPPIR